MMYREFVFIFIDYLKTLNFRVFVFEVFIPLIIGGIVFVLSCRENDNASIVTYQKQILSLLGVLVGFSITIITILTASSGGNIDRIKKIKSKTKIGGHQASVFDLLLMNFVYSVVVEIILIIVHLVYPFFTTSLAMSRSWKLTGFCIVLALMMHILLLTIRNITNLYFILLNDKTS